VPENPTASIVIPTRARPGYLEVALGSIVPQAESSGAEVIVVRDGPDAGTAAVAARHGARLVELPERRGANAARNAGVAAARGELIVFVDDDVEAPPGWLRSLLDGARSALEHEVFGGPIRARLEAGGPRSCGREDAPITTLDLGPRDTDAELVWSANMAIRRAALDRVGPFDERIHGRGEEDEWERRYLAAGGRIRYLAQAGLEHRRTRSDATVLALARAAYPLGRSARRNDARKGKFPPLRAELRTLAGCGWHTVRRRCGNGIVMGAEVAGRVREAWSPVSDPPTEDFVSGTSGLVFGLRATSRALVRDAIADARSLGLGIPWRLRRAASSGPRRRVLVLGIERAGEPNLLARARRELGRSRHQVRFDSTVAGARGKFENLNTLLARNPVDGYDWLLVVDDDVALPRGFLDTFVFLLERFDLQLAQPAHRARSHAAWEVTRRRAGNVARETAYVEIGPVVAFHATTFGTLLPFPELRIGWGLDAHWGAVAKEHGWRLGIVDATPITHAMRKVAASYDRSAAIDEGRRFLSGRPYVKAPEAQRTLVTHRTWK
jgi:glycosyltransferase involved in cell wall biosynthesis